MMIKCWDRELRLQMGNIMSLGPQYHFIKGKESYKALL